MTRYLLFLLGCCLSFTSRAQCVFRNAFQSTLADCSVGMTWLELQTIGWPPTEQWTFSVDFVPIQPFLSHWTQIGGKWRYAVPLNAGVHTLDLPGYTDQLGTEYCWDTYVFPTDLSVTPGDCGINLRIRAALDGALPSGALMTDGLRSAGLLPLAQPYTGLGYTFVGSPTNMSITPSLLAVSGNDALVDWVVVEVRDAAAPSTILYSKPALLQRDGDVVDADGDNYVNCPIAPAVYHVALRHRNHLGVMSASAHFHNVDPNISRHDFTGTLTGWYQGAYGTNAQVLKGGIQRLWAGDATGNGQLRYTGAGNDRDPILTAIGGTTPNNMVSNVYDRRDTNLDGVIKYTGTGNDRDVILINVGSTTPNSTRIQQLP